MGGKYAHTVKTQHRKLPSYLSRWLMRSIGCAPSRSMYWSHSMKALVSVSRDGLRLRGVECVAGKELMQEWLVRFLHCASCDR